MNISRRKPYASEKSREEKLRSSPHEIRKRRPDSFASGVRRARGHGSSRANSTNAAVVATSRTASAEYPSREGAAAAMLTPTTAPSGPATAKTEEAKLRRLSGTRSGATASRAPWKQLSVNHKPPHATDTPTRPRWKPS